jgi:MoxR-like ATPase
VYNPKTGDFGTRQGPVFANLILADEINRAPAKVQSALLEAMQEHQVTIGQETFRLPDPFLVLATQNPIEQEGTYPLPEAQVDRFMLKLVVTYPTRDEERRILDANARTDVSFNVRPVVEPDTLLRARRTVDEIYVDDKIKDYILSIVFASRDPAAAGLDALRDQIRYGASPAPPSISPSPPAPTPSSTAAATSPPRTSNPSPPTSSDTASFRPSRPRPKT